jgi:hypothetical protein
MSVPELSDRARRCLPIVAEARETGSTAATASCAERCGTSDSTLDSREATVPVADVLRLSAPNETARRIEESEVGRVDAALASKSEPEPLAGGTDMRGVHTPDVERPAAKRDARDSAEGLVPTASLVDGAGEVSCTSKFDGREEDTEARTRDLRIPALNPDFQPDSLVGRSSITAGRRRPQARLGTYAASEAPPIDEALNAEVEAAAVAFVLEYERQAGRAPEDMNIRNPNNPGYDIESRVPGGGATRYIEVKGTADPWGVRGVDVTATQIEFAWSRRGQAWLYVVENALDPALRHCWMIQDYAARVERIAFDSGWRKFATESWKSPPSIPSDPDGPSEPSL